MGPQLYLDMDGVLADFEQRAGMLLQTNNIYKYEFVHGAKKFWEALDADVDFFFNLRKMSDASALWQAVRHLKPVILTALPKTGGERVELQKRAWIKWNFGEDVVVIACQTSDKPNFCKPGDILVDDRAVNRDKWKANGGRYILHTSAADTIVRLEALGVLEQA